MLLRTNIRNSSIRAFLSIRSLIVTSHLRTASTAERMKFSSVTFGFGKNNMTTFRAFPPNERSVIACRWLYFPLAPLPLWLCGFHFFHRLPDNLRPPMTAVLFLVILFARIITARAKLKGFKLCGWDVQNFLNTDSAIIHGIQRLLSFDKVTHIPPFSKYSIGMSSFQSSLHPQCEQYSSPPITFFLQAPQRYSDR